MGKKKFIDKKKSAKFQLLARDTSDLNYSDSPGNDRVFVRVDTNLISLDAAFDVDNECEHENEDSIFVDAPEDGGVGYVPSSVNGKAALPENVRKQILELGFPDDGYNYLIHLREIKNTGGGSAFYQNPKFNPDELPHDVKAYDASRVHISDSEGNYNEKSIYGVATNTVNARIVICVMSHCLHQEKIKKRETRSFISDAWMIKRSDSLFLNLRLRIPKVSAASDTREERERNEKERRKRKKLKKKMVM